MSQNKISLYSMSFLIVLISLSFASYSIGSSQILYIPESEKEEELAKSFYEQILKEDLGAFVETLNNYPQYINIVYYYPAYKDYFTLLHLAVLFGKDKFIDELLKRGVDPSLPTLSKDNTVLHISSVHFIVAKFIDLGLDREALNHQNMTPLLVQVFKKVLNRDVILTFLKAGANVEARTDKSGLTALHVLFKPYHSISNQEELLRILEDILDHGGKVDAGSKAGETPLHFAAAMNNVQAISILVDKATKQMGLKKFINIRDFHGNTPLSIAYTSRAKEAISHLLKLGANPLLLNRDKISVNGSAHQESGRSSSFGKFVLDEIAKHFTPPTRCVKSLTKEGRYPLYESK